MNPFAYNPYILKEQEKEIREFRYKGGSDSITYQYIWSPLCDYKWWVKKTIFSIIFMFHHLSWRRLSPSGWPRILSHSVLLSYTGGREITALFYVFIKFVIKLVLVINNQVFLASPYNNDVPFGFNIREPRF